ncbi:hypothetical protein DEU56DRAFT_833241 [Suillus clintonianus]|uniref:uncharacterized protein n=1 Tax=Suillus clintonianus TaxID=1904413 RepID=UPI001B86BDC7|nr:uncharacterized protein DEU56DRAFT_833241 [Suillus clintonianus]KAG2121929.1 hypothetical protein DEU56DRAFT_833241 [Suillus clintonianus]
MTDLHRSTRLFVLLQVFTAEPWQVMAVSTSKYCSLKYNSPWEMCSHSVKRYFLSLHFLRYFCVYLFSRTTAPAQ